MANIKDNKLLQKIALVLKELREGKDLTQEEVYNDTNIHIGRIETGKGNINVSTLAALCTYYQIKLSDFLKMVEKIK
ncbi:MAG: helix-turn-helix transcriptional regulator [Bacteroidota bacterium]|nr:helix-turn-helix transcriptional regulator [Bacteroidota bacterium]